MTNQLTVRLSCRMLHAARWVRRLGVVLRSFHCVHAILLAAALTSLALALVASATQLYEAKVFFSFALGAALGVRGQ
jgi:hypothetical protein